MLHSQGTQVDLDTSKPNDTSANQAPTLLPKIPDDSYHVKLSQLQKHLDEAQKDKSDLKKRLDAAQSRIRELEMIVSQYSGHGRSDKKDLEIRTLREEARKADARSRGLKAELGRYQAILRKAEARETEAQEGLNYWKNQNLVLSEQLMTYETEIQRRQEKSIRDMTDGRWNPVPDDTIRDRFEMLHRDIRDWAKQWAGGPLRLDSLGPETANDFIQKYLVEFVQCAKDSVLPVDVAKPKPKMKDKMTSLLLTAALAYEIQTCFFEDAFFCVDPKHGRVLGQMHQDFVKGSKFPTRI